jgi:hypothetical protein
MPVLDGDRSSIVAKITISLGRTAARLDHLLDAALGDTFPASDPVSELRVSSPAVEILRALGAGPAPL